MPRLLTLSRAARLVGVSRGALQKKIRDGELRSFEGQVDLAELSRVFPQARLEDDTLVERLELVVENALRRARYAKLKKLTLPDPATLASRVAAMSRELNEVKSRLGAYAGIVQETAQRLAQLDADDPDRLVSEVQALQAWFERALAEGAPAQAIPTRLLAKDTLLRIMAAHVKLLPSGHEFLLDGMDTILDAGLQAGLALDYGCTSGTCGQCKARVVSGEVKKVRHHDFVIPEAERLQGYVLTCCHTAVTDLVLEAAEAGSERDIPRQQVTAWVKRLEPLGEDVMGVQLRTPRTKRLRFLAGQRVTLRADNGAQGEYPVASCPCEELNLQFHIARTPGDAFAEYVFTALRPSASIEIAGPFGDFVLDEDIHRPALFLACGIGFAPIKGLIEQAVALDSFESLHLYCFHAPERLPYQHNLCRAWDDALDGFAYTPLPIPPAEGPDQGLAARLSAHKTGPLWIVVDRHPALGDCEVYVAGPAEFVDGTAALLIQQGLPRGQLHVQTTA